MEPYIIDGGKYIDDRGTLRFVNDFQCDRVKRFYIIENTNANKIRAWQGHQFETKYFYCIKGSFLIHAIQVDDWINPSADLTVFKYELREETNGILVVPSGFVNGIKSLTANSILQVFSDRTLEESIQDDFRYSKDNWDI